MSQDYFADYAAVRQVMGQYIESARQGKSAVMQKVFAENAIMYGQVNGKITGGPIQNLWGCIRLVNMLS